MELRELAAFREVARLSSFSRAAHRLGYVQSTVTAQIQSLERDLGVQLFDRLPRSVVLTQAGNALLPAADQLLSLVAEARAAATSAAAETSQPTGTVSVSAPESVLTYRLPGVLQRLRLECPGVIVDLRPTPIGRFRSTTRRAIEQGEVDIAVVLDAKLRPDGFAVQVLAPEPISVIAPAGHPLASARTVVPADLDGVALLLPEAPDQGCVYRGQFERHLADAHLTLPEALEFASIETVKQCVIAGMGVSVVPRVSVETELAAGRLVQLPWRGRFDAHTQIVWNARRSFGSAHAAFLRVARESFARRRPARSGKTPERVPR